MSQLKNRLQALTLLDRAFAAITDEELVAIVTTLPDRSKMTARALVVPSSKASTYCSVIAAPPL